MVPRPCPQILTNGTWIVQECRQKNPDWANLVTVIVDPELEHTSASNLARDLGQVKNEIDFVV